MSNPSKRLLIISPTDTNSFSQDCLKIFQRAILDYHRNDDYDYRGENPFRDQTIEALLYRKCWIDNVQWHFEDQLRDPLIDPKLALELKQRIDLSNQDRTDVVEDIDDYIAEIFESTGSAVDSRYNTESPAWAVDRLSILVLNIYQTNVEFLRTEDLKQRRKCGSKLKILIDQKLILCSAIDRLIMDIDSGFVKFRHNSRQNV